MNLFGLEITLAGKQNGYVRVGDCQRNHDRVDKSIEDLEHHIDTRFDDIKDFILKNGK